MISVENVSKSFGPVQALQNVSFEIKRGEVIGLLGPNGAGKTTMMRLLTGFFPPTEGKILFDGNPIFSGKADMRSFIGYLAENNPLYKDMVVIDFLRHIASLKGIKWTKLKSSVEQVMARCKIEDVRFRMIGKLSKGYAQRVGLAQALLGDPELLILDEPTSGLDPKQIIEIRSLIKALGRERTVLLSTHILPEAKAACERVLILNEGWLVASGTAQDLEAALQESEEFRIQIRGLWKIGDEFLSRVRGVQRVQLIADRGEMREYVVGIGKHSNAQADLARAVIGRGFQLLMLKPTETNLEDVFLKIVKTEAAEEVV